MGVIQPGYHLKSEYDLPALRSRILGNKRRRDINDELTLTSLIDIFAVVILFLIQSFSATGEIFMVNPGITLPQAQFAKVLDRYPIVTVQRDKVTLEGYEVGDNANLQAKVDDTDWDLPLLRGRLEAYKIAMQTIYPEAPFPGNIIIQADRGLEFLYLKRVLFSLASYGFPNAQLAVRGDAAPSSSETPQESTVEAPEETPKEL